jgi:hypothetical protein
MARILFNAFKLISGEWPFANIWWAKIPEMLSFVV